MRVCQSFQYKYSSLTRIYFDKLCCSSIISRSALISTCVPSASTWSYRTGCHFYSYQQYKYICHLPSLIDWLVYNNWFTSASLFILSHQILLCARVVVLSEKASIYTIQYGYSKWGTHARVFLQTLSHGNRKNEIRQRKRNIRRDAWAWKEVKRARKMKSKRPRALDYSSSLSSPGVSTPLNSGWIS